MDIRHMQYVLELARYRNFTKAAAALHITQPTLSKAIKGLEDELGVELFTREGKRVELTDAGRAITGQADNIIESFRNLTRELSDLTNLNKGVIHLGLPPMAGSSFFPQIIRNFRRQYPGLVIQTVEDGGKKLEMKVAEGKLDVGVVLLPVDKEKFHSFTVVNESMKLLVHPDHPLAGRTRASLAELAGDSFILFREEFSLHNRIIEECIRVGFHPEVLYESSQWDFIYEMAASGLGVALLPETICRILDHSRVRILELEDPVIPWHLGMIWRRKSYLSFAAREWIRFTREIFEGRQP
ncbi:MAG: cynR 1 [Paenibacillaceae bacterium]|jgi:DNA-binding transcriptional LysR family regulator|nr:cynR 1 [Paenibacillaceae bacterium]